MRWKKREWEGKGDGGREREGERKREPVAYVLLVNGERERESNQIESRVRQNKAIVITE